MTNPLASATGRRKESTAHVKLMPGDGKIIVNGKSAIEYLKRDVLVMMVEQPLQVTETVGSYDIVANTKGGGPRPRHMHNNARRSAREKYEVCT